MSDTTTVLLTAMMIGTSIVTGAYIKGVLWLGDSYCTEFIKRLT